MPTHGLYTTYVNHKCRCKPCIRANTNWCENRRRERIQLVAAGLLEVPHGSEGGYRNYACRCDLCKKAHAEMRAATIRRRRARALQSAGGA